MKCLTQPGTVGTQCHSTLSSASFPHLSLSEGGVFLYPHADSLFKVLLYSSYP